MIRDYLQTVIDKNPGSRCIVTTVTGPTEEQEEAMKRGEAVDISYGPRFMDCFIVSVQLDLDMLRAVGLLLA
jgi:hypothetical protein